MDCISVSSWVPWALMASFAFGISLGLCLRFGLDYAELASYRRIVARYRRTLRAPR